MQLAVGDRGIDFSVYRLNPPNAAVADGCKFILRYSAGAASRPTHPSYPINKPKLITPLEYGQLTTYYPVLANSEWYEGRVTEGASAGFEDGQADFELWKSCGYPQGWPVFVSWDQYPAEANYPGVEDYLRNHQAGMDKAAGVAKYYVTDLYAGEGGIGAMQARGLAPIGWRTMASSWNDYIPAAQSVATIIQTGNYWFGQQADENILARPLSLGGDDSMSAQDVADLKAWLTTQVVGPLNTVSSKVTTVMLDPNHTYSLQSIRAAIDLLSAAVKAGVDPIVLQKAVTAAIASASFPVSLTGTAGTVNPNA